MPDLVTRTGCTRPPKFWYENDEYLTLEWGIVRTNNVRYDDVDAVPSDGAESAPLYQVKRVLQGMAPDYTFSEGSCHIDNTREFRVMNAERKYRSCITMPEELEPDEARAANLAKRMTGPAEEPLSHTPQPSYMGAPDTRTLCPSWGRGLAGNPCHRLLIAHVSQTRTHPRMCGIDPYGPVGRMHVPRTACLSALWSAC